MAISTESLDNANIRSHHTLSFNSFFFLLYHIIVNMYLYKCKFLVLKKTHMAEMFNYINFAMSEAKELHRLYT